MHFFDNLLHDVSRPVFSQCCSFNIATSFNPLLRKFSMKIALKLNHCDFFMVGGGGGDYDNVYQS